MNKIILQIEGMSCSACSQGLEKYLNKQDGIVSANVNLVLQQALIEYEDNLTIADLNRFVSEAGFKSLGEYNNKISKNNRTKDKKMLIGFAILAILIMYISMSHMIGLPNIPFLDMKQNPLNYSICLFFLTSLSLIYGIDIFKSGFKNIIHKTPNMDSLVSLGVFASFLYSTYSTIMVILGNTSYIENLYFESVSTIILFIKLGRFIDLRSKEKTRDAIKELVQITPSTALLKTNDGEKEITIDEVKKDDILIAKPGMKIAVDGVIVSGQTHLDEAFITGESIPTKKSVNDKIVAGSINHDGYIEYKAIKIGKNSTISEIVRLVIEATNTKAKVSRFADKVSGIFVPLVISIAFITLIIYLISGSIISTAINSFVTVLVVSCPCALGLATPLAIVISEGMCAKNGILVKSSEILENAHKIDTIVFDKTGTLTYGNLKVSKILNYSDYTNDELLCIASSVESKSSHPIAKAFVDYTKENNLKIKEVKEFENIPGIGLKARIDDDIIHVGNNKLLTKFKIANKYKEDEKSLSSEGNSIVYIIENKKVIGLIGVNDIIRSTSKYTIVKLNKLGKEVIMLTGDNETTANIIAHNIGIKKVVSNVMPKDKTKYIEKLINEGKNVMMIGDGINDAPALSLANIGVSVNSGTDIAADSADVILIHNDLKNIIDLITISKKTIRNIKQNLFWAFFYNICMIPIATGLLKPLNIYMNPMMASFAMMISSLTVVFNALRLKNIKLEKRNNNV